MGRSPGQASTSSPSRVISHGNAPGSDNGDESDKCPTP
jgi:hypothetical protein